MTDERPDLKPLRQRLLLLVVVIGITLAFLLSLTLYLYGRFTAGAHVTP